MNAKNLLLATIAIISFAIRITAQTSTYNIPTNGLVAWYPFNGNANDESGNGNNGNLNSVTLTADRNGNTNSAYNFIGQNSYIDIGSGGLSNNPTNCSFSVWFKLSSVYTNTIRQSSILMSKRHADDGSSWTTMSIGNDLNTNNCQIDLVVDGQGHVTNVYGGQSVCNNQWYNMVGTKSGNTYSIYLNGIFINSVIDNFNQPGSIYNMHIGHQGAWGNWFNGQIDDIAIYNRALTQSEITSLYTTSTCTSTTSTSNLTIPSTGLPYSWNGLTFNSSGSQTAHLTNAGGCDSSATLNLTVTLPSFLPTNGLVAWYPFNNNAYDVSGHGNNGTVNGAILTTDRNGNPNSAFLFDGINDRIEIAHNQLLNCASVSISVWFKTNNFQASNGYGPHLLSKRESSGWGNSFQMNVGINQTQNACWADWSISGNGGIYFNNSSLLNTNNWFNLVYTHDGNNVNLYLNGTLVNSMASPGLLASNSLPLWFGARPNAGYFSSWFNGNLDDIGIWNRALTQTEITQLYTNCVATTSTTNLTIASSSLPYLWNGLTFNASGSQTKHLTNAGGCDSSATLNLTVINTALPSYLPTNGLAAWYPFNGNANDESGNGNNGIVYGATLTNDRNGSLNSAYNFNVTSSNHISINNSLGNFGTSNFTVSGWQLRASGSNIYCMFGKRDAFGSGNYFEVNSNPGFEIRQGTNNSDYVNDGGLSYFNSNQWFHTTIVRNGNQIFLYLNGALTNIYTSPITQNISNNALTEIGARYAGNSLTQLYDGKLDDIGIWNRALTQTEITALYSSSQNAINLNLTAFLEGSCLSGGNMMATLNKVNASISNNIADTIIVELHANTSPYAIMYSSKGIINTNGTASIAFPNSAIGGSYYIVIKHRNSIETWSAAPVAINNNSIYNFTSSASQAFGANLSNMGDGVFAIFSGDINQDGSVDFNDYPDLDIASNLGVLGYDVNDLNGDASVDFNDYPILDLNSNNGVLSVKP